MFSHNDRYYGKIQELNNQFRFQAKEETTPGRFKLQSLKTNIGLSSLKRKTFSVNSPEKRINISSNNQARGNNTPVSNMSPIQRKVTVRISTTKWAPRKAETINKRHSFFGSTKNSPLIKAQIEDDHDDKVSEDSMEDVTTIRETTKFIGKATKPEVTVSEYDISKKWYEYEKKIGNDLKFTSSLGSKGNVGLNKMTMLSPLSVWEDITIQGNLKIQRKITSNLNPLVSKSNSRTPIYSPNISDYEDRRVIQPKKVSTKMLSITSIGASNNFNPDLKWCSCHPKDIDWNKIQLEIELNRSKQSELILKQEITQLRELNRQLIDKLHNYGVVIVPPLSYI